MDRMELGLKRFDLFCAFAFRDDLEVSVIESARKLGEFFVRLHFFPFFVFGNRSGNSLSFLKP